VYYENIDYEVYGLYIYIYIYMFSDLPHGDHHSHAQIKASVEGLLEAGGELAKLGVIKQRAVESEDFDTAEMIRKQVDMFRRRVYKVYGVSSRAGQRELGATAAHDDAVVGNDDHHSSGTRTHGNHNNNNTNNNRVSSPRSARSVSGRGDPPFGPPPSRSSIPSAIPRTPPLPEIGSVSGRSTASSPRGLRRNEPMVYLGKFAPAFPPISSGGLSGRFLRQHLTLPCVCHARIESSH
jgi:hypothetical protein